MGKEPNDLGRLVFKEPLKKADPEKNVRINGLEKDQDISNCFY